MKHIEILRNVRVTSNIKHVDVIVLGAGPAGISCALELNASKINCLVIDRNQAPGGQLADIPTPVTNLATGRFESGKAVQASLCAAGAQLDMVLGETIEVCDLKGALKKLSSKSLEYHCSCVFLATGYRLRLLDESERFQSFGNDIVYHTGTRQAEFVDKNVIILGGGDSAVLEALERAGTAKSVTLVNRSGNYRARPDLMREIDSHPRIVRLDNYVLRDMQGCGRLQEIELHSTTDDTKISIAADKLVVKIGYRPNTEIFAGQVDMDSTGHIRIDAECKTSVPCVFAGGDMVTPGYDRIATAVGHGMLAARSIRRQIETE